MSDHDVLIVSSNGLFREALKHVLADMPDHTHTSQVSSLQEAEELIQMGLVEDRLAGEPIESTGEPIPVEKTPGDTVIGGTVNGTGSFVMVATKVGDDTVLSQIVRMVAEASTPSPRNGPRSGTGSARPCSDAAGARRSRRASRGPRAPGCGSGRRRVRRSRGSRGT